MFPIAKELVDRFIEWLLRRASGETLEEKQNSAIRYISYVAGGLLWAVLTLVVIDINLSLRIHATEGAAAAVNKMFSTDRNPIDELIKINRTLSDRVESLREENILLIKDNLRLLDQAKVMEDVVKTCKRPSTKKQ